MAIFNSKTGEKKFVGLVLHVRGTFRMDTSMDEVLVWNPETKSAFVEHLCGSDWFAEKDASDEVVKAYYDSIRELQKQVDVENQDSLMKALRSGAEVLVYKGRKIPVGTVGRVKRVVDGRFGKSVLLESGEWVNADNLKIQYKGEFVDHEVFYEKTFYFQAV